MMDKIREAMINDAFNKWKYEPGTKNEEKIWEEDDFDFSRVTFRAGYLAALSAPVASDARELAVNDFRMDELDAVMVSVDKWFDEGDPRLKNNPATRAADAREIALKAIEASATEQGGEMREALERIIDHAEDWHAHYCEMWGERRKEQQDAILGDIMNARALLAREEKAK